MNNQNASSEISPLYGALGGDLVGSIYEHHNIKTKDFPLLSLFNQFSDDSVMTLATAEALLEGDEGFARSYHTWGNRFPHAGYGGRFKRWLNTPVENLEPYNSWGNGSAMRVSPVGFACATEEEVLALAAKSAEVTHNHPEGIKGAQATALAVFWAKNGRSMTEIQQGISERFGYDLTTPLDEIRPAYHFDVSCQGTVPVAMRAFLESCSYEDAIRNAISVGGDSDTLAAITGGIALAFFREMPPELVAAIEGQMTAGMKELCRNFAERFPAR